MIHSIPASIRNLGPRIEAAIEKWPIGYRIDDALKWVLQFESSDYDIAAKVIENLVVISTQEIRDSLAVANTKLIRKISEKGSAANKRNTIYAGIGNSAKSGSLMAYHYRVTTDTSESDFLNGEDESELDLSNIENIVLVDDVIGTGKTVSREVKKIVEEIYPLLKTRNIFVLTVAGYEDGIQSIITDTGASVVCALEFNSKDTVANLDAVFYEGMCVSERSFALERIKRYCRSISTSNLGYGELGGLLVFDHNTPNTTLPIVWHNGKGWNPLFQRAKRIPGMAKILNSAQAEQKKQQSQSPNTVVELDELTVFVEGKIDELFIDYMRMHCDLANKLNVKKVNAVALGGLYQSDRLITLLRETKKNAIFVLDNDQFSMRASKRLETLHSAPILYLSPSFISLLDLDKVFNSRDRFPGIPDDVDHQDAKSLHQIEISLFKKSSASANSERIIQLLEEFISQEKIEEFITGLKNELNKPKAFNPPPINQ